MLLTLLIIILIRSLQQEIEEYLCTLNQLIHREKSRHLYARESPAQRSRDVSLSLSLLAPLCVYIFELDSLSSTDTSESLEAKECNGRTVLSLSSYDRRILTIMAFLVARSLCLDLIYTRTG